MTFFQIVQTIYFTKAAWNSKSSVIPEILLLCDMFSNTTERQNVCTLWMYPSQKGYEGNFVWVKVSTWYFQNFCPWFQKWYVKWASYFTKHNNYRVMYTKIDGYYIIYKYETDSCPLKRQLIVVSSLFPK